MNFISVDDGYEIKVGDRIKFDKNAYGVSYHIVHRVTPKYAFVKWNEIAEGKFPRVYNKFGFSVLPHPKWRTVTYTVEKLITP